MASVNTLLGEVLEELGYPNESLSSTLALRVRASMFRTYRVRIPTLASSLLNYGALTLTPVEVPDTPTAEDVISVYAWGQSVHSVRSPLILVDAAGTQFRPAYYTNEKDFWRDAGDLLSTDTGNPAFALVRGRKIQLRPLLDTTAGGSGPWTLHIAASLFPDAPANDDDDLISLELEDAVVQGTVNFEAIRDGDDEIAARSGGLFSAALGMLRRTAAASERSVPKQEIDF